MQQESLSDQRVGYSMADSVNRIAPAVIPREAIPAQRREREQRERDLSGRSDSENTARARALAAEPQSDNQESLAPQDKGRILNINA